MSANGSGEGFGAVTWWGFTPALDFQMKGLSASMEHLRLTEKEVSELNILMVGAGDSRHLLKTICQAHRWKHRRINFYVIENNLELIGRHLLFLTLAVEPPDHMGLQEKSEVFLELFGNSLIRSQTATYLQDKANLFIHYITDLDAQQKKLPAIDLSALKFKERDQLEAIFKFWRNPDPKVFLIDKMWDIRNGHYLGSRYDSRKGCYDWDLNMKLHDRGAALINKNEYNRWREKGVAFEIREGVYDIPNKSLASGMLMKHKGEKVPARGYWGDIVTGPYIAFGIETEEQSLMKTANGVYTKTAQDISHHNILALFHELVAKERYVPPSSVTSPLELQTQANLSEITEEKENTLSDEESSSGKEAAPKIVGQEKDFIPLKDIEIHFLPLNCISELHHKSKYVNLFNIIYFSCSMVHNIKPELKLLAAPKATLIVELTKFLLDIRKEQIAGFANRVTEMASEAGFIPFGQSDGEHDFFARFQLEEEQ
uniref:Dynein axonemal assembly factor 3 n=1 Tax=Latimeria chalumnae TaxID=7897 RepID=H3APX1_LATCH|nr:PREDICTED: dynein assembly factor 3, axonemal [Latimeria chalumnae]XP_014342038.1 PREDICTED: dynein assembly factor 3, axonemal [Latimeria chalumnae]XP_014342039.1 PREDICTED: dynein assembly factor 3, axonemal [Latimeria chalumnae]|eukprot:XP_005992877.1 PREDICTED: dynein assembly factor 3, axonemal [Latimeria chalumnae]